MILISDLLLSIDRGLPLPRPLIVRGRIAKARRGRDRAFFQVQDPTGSVQVVLEGTAFDLVVVRPEVGSRWQFEGEIDVSHYKQTAEADYRPTLVAERAANLSLLSPPKQLAKDDIHAEFLESRAALAQVRSLASKVFGSLGYLEIEPRFITLASPLYGLEPLQVRYVGFGAPAHLFPSPAGQLRKVLEGTDITRVFAVSRIFTTTFRDEVTSNEALTLMAMKIVETSREAKARPYDLEHAFKLMAEGEGLVGGFVDWFSAEGTFPTSYRKGPPLPIDGTLSQTTFESYDAPEEQGLNTSDRVELFQRLVSPPRRVLAERTLTSWYGDKRLEVTTVHLERLTEMLADLNVRRLAVIRVER